MAPSDISTAIAFLFSLERLGMKFGLENMMTICAALGHPERRFRSIIVAGTNGKGSVTAMTSAALHAAGLRSARYTSPHLERLEERFVIGEREVDAADLESAAQNVRETVERLVAAGQLPGLPTFFECSTAIAFELFQRADVDIAVVEVGLGGRLDATNVITPIAAAIASIDFDHQELLGTSLDVIAREKAGVIKPGIPVVVGEMAPEAAAVIEETCRERGATFIDVPSRVRATSVMVAGATRVTLQTAAHDLSDVTLALRGRHQVRNAAVALCLMEALADAGVHLAQDAIVSGLTGASWPGRLERLTWHGADVLLDAAHNPAGARALAEYLHDAGWRDVTLVVGVMRDKDVAGMLAPLLPLATRVVCTTAPSPRALAAEELAALARTLSPQPDRIAAIPDPQVAITDACRAGSRVVVAGSIFLIGPVRGILR
jgi:dihydrofolate synthase / folylpolyglutamate synthase